MSSILDIVNNTEFTNDELINTIINIIKSARTEEDMCTDEQCKTYALFLAGKLIKLKLDKLGNINLNSNKEEFYEKLKELEITSEELHSVLHSDFSEL